MIRRLVPLWTLLLALGAAIPAQATGGVIDTPVTGPITVNAGETLEIVTGGVVTSGIDGVIVNTGGELIISGGSVSGSESGVRVAGGTATILHGSVSGSSFLGSAAGVLVDGGAATIGGLGQVSVDGFSGVRVSDGTATISDAFVSGERFGVVVNGGTATISGGSQVSGVFGVGVASGTATISEDGFVSGTGAGVRVAGGTAILSGGIVLGNGIGAIGVRVEGGTATISDGNVFGAEIGVEVNDGAATLSGGSVSGTAGGVVVNNGAATLSGGSVSGGLFDVAVGGGTATIVGCNLHFEGLALTGILQDGSVINPLLVSVSGLGQLILDSDTTQITCPANQIVVTNSATGAVVNYPPPTVANTCGSPVTVTSLPASGSLFPLGATTVTGTVTDLLGNSSSCSFTVRVLTLEQASEELVEAVEALVPSPLSAGQGKALTSLLKAAFQKLQQGKGAAALPQLQAFIQQVQGLIKAGTLTAAQGQPLIDAAQAIITALGG